MHRPPEPETSRNGPYSPDLMRPWLHDQGGTPRRAKSNVALDCGWGRLIFAQTFTDSQALLAEMKKEEAGKRDIAFYISDPHVILAQAPMDVFLDPSHTYRLWMNRYRPRSEPMQGFRIRRLGSLHDADSVMRIYAANKMVTCDPGFFFVNRGDPRLTWLVAECTETHQVMAAVTGIDHVHAFNDPENGSSLWCLAVSPQAHYPGIGEALVRGLTEHYAGRGRSFMDLSVLHDNDRAISLYERLGFERLPLFAVKNKNPINEKLFAGPPIEEQMNPYAMIIINEARRRGIAAEVLDAEGGFFKLIYGGRSVACRESLSQMTDAVAMSRCDDKAVTRRVLEAAGLRVPGQIAVTDLEQAKSVLAKYGQVVVKPARGEQGRGISVDVRDAAHLEEAIEAARQHCETVLVEEFVQGQDLRIIVIDYRVVAAAIRKPPKIAGNDEATVRELIEGLSRRRAAATGGESTIPLDAETERCIRLAGYGLDDVLPQGEQIMVRKTANLHTGGTIHDVTDRLHHRVVDAAILGAKALGIPVVGFDFLVPDITGPEYVVIEANERPGLANHEPQPTAERFIDLLFPQTAADLPR
ncbi:MAG: N-acetylglutaminylglutamine synthetase [Alphaproteobacteria bacterium]|jgi:GNAT-family acetyltransferase (TIGR03103 family)|nr:N-acetylglutaminylglutamine synthetase [Alphaproteobacteria bacterium]